MTTGTTVTDHAPPWARALADRIEAQVGAPPLNDVALTRLTYAAPGVRHLVTAEGDGYAQLDLSGPQGAVQVVAEAGGALDALLAAAAAQAPGRDLLVWSHGARSQVAAAARRSGFTPVRELRQLRLALRRRPDVPEPPAGVLIRPFQVGRDEAAWLAVNAAAFAHHPEQGALDAAALAQLEAEPWFEPAGFLLACDQAGGLLGYHWTKRHTTTLGEVYVLGIAPGAQGRGLGGVLLAAGLAHLVDAGCSDVLLYVEGDNAAALHLYERAGFATYDTDVQLRRPAAGPVPDRSDKTP